MASPVQTFKIPGYVLDDLCSRFIINIPEEERADLVRIFFQIEMAHWFYLDFYCEEEEALKPCGIKDFSAQIFRHCPLLSELAGQVDSILENWKMYKMSVPTYGAIMLDPTLTYVLLVQGFRSKTSWSFPKGKINENEACVACAIREVYEETGYELHNEDIRDDEYIEVQRNQLTRLYIVTGISMDTPFQPHTRNEIKCLQWFPVDHLPTHVRDFGCKDVLNVSPNNFFMVIPFVKELKKWIKKAREVANAFEKSTGRRKHSAHSKVPERPNKNDKMPTLEPKSTSKNKKQKKPNNKNLEKVRQQFAKANRDVLNSLLGVGAESSQVQGTYESPVIPSPAQFPNGSYQTSNSSNMTILLNETKHEQLSTAAEVHTIPSNTSNDIPCIVSSPTWLNFKFDIPALLATLPSECY